MNRPSTKTPLLGFLVLVIAAGMAFPAAAAGSDSVPLRNWQVPPIETMFQTYGPLQRGDSMSKQFHVVNPTALIFQTTVPCRMVDTRGLPGVFFGGPIFANGETRTYDFTQIAATCASLGSTVPANILAWSLNITVTGTLGGSFLTAWPTGTVRPTVATVNWVGAGAQVNNSVIVPAGTSDAFDVFVGVSTHVIIDLNGFFIANMSDAGDRLFINTNIGGQAAILGQNTSNTNGSHGIGGFVSGTGIVHGVQGQISAAANTGSSGVHGIGAATAGRTFGVLGESLNTITDGAGIFGTDGAGASGSTGWFSTGVRGHGKNGVIGITNTAIGDGVIGVAVSPATVGVRTIGNFTATGTKAFIEPHPTDPSLNIRYVALEGPEAGTYFRGTAKTVDREAVIQVPDSFRIVTAEEGLTVQLTPVGALAQMAVMSQDLNQIVVRSSREATFHYHVNGIRRAFRDWQAVTEGHEFRPVSPDQTMPGWLTEEAKGRLISNGTYNPDGTVNMITAERLGWAKVWREEAAAAAAARK